MREALLHQAEARGREGREGEAGEEVGARFVWVRPVGRSGGVALVGLLGLDCD